MKEKKILIGLTIVLLSIFLFSCGKQSPKTDVDKNKTNVTDTTKKTTANVEETVLKIQKFRAEGELKLNENKFTKKEVIFKDNVKETIKQKWEKMEAYYEGDKVVRIQLYPHKGASTRTEEFYLMDNKLAFAFIQESEEKHEGKDMGEPGKEFYFDNNKLIKYVNTTGEEDKNKDEELKMYESRLPFEVTDLLDILKNVK